MNAEHDENSLTLPIFVDIRAKIKTQIAMSMDHESNEGYALGNKRIRKHTPHKHTRRARADGHIPFRFCIHIGHALIIGTYHIIVCCVLSFSSVLNCSVGCKWASANNVNSGNKKHYNRWSSSSGSNTNDDETKKQKQR